MLLSMYVFSQSAALRVDTMFYDAVDLEATANIYNDNNNNPCALLKVALPLTDAVIEKSADVMNVSYHDGEYWVYVTASDDYGAVQLVIKHPEYHPLTIKFSDWLTEYVKGRCVYRIRVSVPDALMREANSAYNRLDMREAENLYMQIASNPNANKSDVAWAKSRLDLIPRLNHYVAQYNGRIKDYTKIKETGNSAGLIKSLTGAQDCLLQILSLDPQLSLASKHLGWVESTKNKLEGIVIVDVKLILHRRGESIVSLNQMLKNVQIVINDKMKKTVNTDANGCFHLELSKSLFSSDEVKIEVKCKDSLGKNIDGKETINISQNRRVNIMLE